MRRAARTLGVAAAALLAAACSDSPPTSSPPASVPAGRGTLAAPPPEAEPAVAVAVAQRSRFVIESFDLASAGASEEAAQRMRSGIGDALDRYLERAVLAPLRSGQPVDDLSSLFAGAAAERVAGSDRAALVDDGLPPMNGVVVEKAIATVAVLAHRDGDALASARIVLQVTGVAGLSPVTVERSGELLLGPEGDTWKISGYQVRATKDSRERATAGA